MKYSDKLKDPRWQKMRLKILERDKWQCRGCGNEKETLHVHHAHYVSGREPWDYPELALRTLCAKCHQDEHEHLIRNKAILMERLGDMGYSAEALYDLSYTLMSKTIKMQPVQFLATLSIVLQTKESYAKFVKLADERVAEFYEEQRMKREAANDQG